MRSMGLRARAGQAALEYVLALCALLVVVGAMWYLVVAARNRSELFAPASRSKLDFSDSLRSGGGLNLTLVS